MKFFVVAFIVLPLLPIVTAMAGGATPAFALGNLVLLPPFALVARRLVRARENAPETVASA